ncbi:TrbG/VirB9 family P-type conjugative transfer protein [Burkholderia gladioli]|uniref:TrbG/VirB9 family P-type conjugative transfer protein n=1 Tax=Burkholderia gladioli TaxID=28095 RepID=UPI00265658B0|nr:TrbG/VirB9 family P-type conjugative transfer protein [Burkholderia gladioli]MDN7919255.1 TrbG/VirB9 family P-type conjugative transfer protein [Burkholderia gladioli]
MTRPAIKVLRLLAAAPVAALLGLNAGCATTPGTQVGQFDFQYSASGAGEVRPYQVFDDGSQTFLQFDHPLPTNAQVFINVPSGQLPQTITRNGELISVPSIADGLTIVAGDARASVLYRGRSHATRYDVRDSIATTPPDQLAAATPTPVPDTAVASVPIASSEPQAAGTHGAPFASAAAMAPNPGAGGRLRPTLQSAFGIARIEAGPDGSTRLIFATKPDPTLMVADQRGYPLDPVWLAGEKALVVRPVDRLRITTPEFSFEVARVSGIVYRYDPTLGLKKVFDERGTTYFAFDHAPRRLKITDEHGRGRGSRRGAYYRYRGTRDRYVVTLDGTTFDVTRAPVVRFYARERS